MIVHYISEIMQLCKRQSPRGWNISWHKNKGKENVLVELQTKQIIVTEPTKVKHVKSIPGNEWVAEGFWIEHQKWKVGGF